MDRAFSEAEWQTRVDLAACYRLVAHYGMADMIANHILARVPDQPGAFLVNARFRDRSTRSSIEKQMISQGADPVGGTPAEFGQFVQREYEKWKLVVRESGATAE